MPRYRVVTLVDITRSNPSRAETDPIKLGQQANFNSLVQAIGLRANIEWRVDPVMNVGVLPYPIDGKATHWIWEFDVEREFLFQKGSDPVGLLLDDLNGVPILNRLKNSADIDPAIFQTKNSSQNIWIAEIG